MALNFRLSYNTGFDYTDLFPYTTLEAVQGTDKILKYTTMDIAVSPFDGLEQTVSMPLTEKQANAPFDVYLVEKSAEAMYAYCSIDQIESTKDGFTLTRLGRASVTPINLKIIFKEAGYDA